MKAIPSSGARSADSLSAQIGQEGHNRELPARKVFWWLAWAVLAGGCAGPSIESPAHPRGRGIAEYRAVAREAHRSVAEVVKALESLAPAPNQTSLPPNALPRFDKSFHQLELASVKARARAEAILNRGDEYFEEWKGNLARMTNQALARVETRRYQELLNCFKGIRQRSLEVRQEFGPFMAKLREFRAALDRNADASSQLPPAGTVQELNASGRRVLQSLESVATALDDAQVKLKEQWETTKRN